MAGVGGRSLDSWEVTWAPRVRGAGCKGRPTSVEGGVLFSWGEERPLPRAGQMHDQGESGLSRGSEGPLGEEVCSCGMWHLS